MSEDGFERAMVSYLGPEKLARIRSTKIGIAGAGGLGSNCAFNLVRTGVRSLKIVDFDVVEPKNLNRQFYFLDQVGMSKVDALKLNLQRICPDVTIETSSERIESDNIVELFSDCDIVVEAFDKAAYKSMLVTRLLPLKELIVSGSGLAGVGRSDEIVVHRLKKNLVIVGDLRSDIRSSPPLSPRVNIAAAKQADVVLEHLLGPDIKFERHLP
jgi:sulfur carrier protein ThiS adenylyltransferase